MMSYWRLKTMRVYTAQGDVIQWRHKTMRIYTTQSDVSQYWEYRSEFAIRHYESRPGRLVLYYWFYEPVMSYKISSIDVQAKKIVWIYKFVMLSNVL